MFGLIPKAKVICEFAAEGAGIEIIQNQRFLRSMLGMPCVGNANALIERGSGHQCGLLLIKCSRVCRFPMGDYAPGRNVGFASSWFRGNEPVLHLQRTRFYGKLPRQSTNVNRSLSPLGCWQQLIFRV